MSGAGPPQPLDPAAYEDRSGVPIAVVTVTLSIATLCVCLRSYARAYLIRQFGPDDWAAVAALVFAMGSGIMVASNTRNGHGKHMAVVDPALLGPYMRTFYISIVLYNASLTAIKTTFLLQYYRILGTGVMRTIIIVAFFLIGLWSVSQLLVVVFTCSPIPKFWTPDMEGTCIPNLPFWYINAAGNIVTDVAVFLLPLPALSRLNLRRGQKLGLLGVFSLGFFTCAISVIRIQYLKLSPDVTWDNVASSCWSIGELCSGITCACLPTLRPLITRCLPGLRSQSEQSGGNQYGSTPYSSDKRSGRRRRGRHNQSELSTTLQTIGSAGTGRFKKRSTDEEEAASSRGIIYPEDVELQSDDRSDKGIRSNAVEDGYHNPYSHGGYSIQQNVAPNESHSTYARTMDKLKLGLKSTVQTEIRVGSAGKQLTESTG
ncbi:hypothetical protein B0J18DRAFT_445595 [Chaetomium sp. MPI-SDFR-AT-0129]|nr:hypothetical protein B0J18DRAFT_445595 [Chaetomium sp. MPI-SDFR-AT-0129]